MIQQQVAYLEINSWRGISIGAKHWYGTLKWGDSRVELTRILSKEDAVVLNKQRGDDYVYRAGDVTNAFDSEYSVRLHAVRYITEHLLEIKVLLEGSRATIEPKEVVMGSDGFKKYSRKAIEKCERLDWYDSGNDDEVDAIINRWYKRLRKELRENGASVS